MNKTVVRVRRVFLPEYIGNELGDTRPPPTFARVSVVANLSIRATMIYEACAGTTISNRQSRANEETYRDVTYQHGQAQ